MWEQLGGFFNLELSLVVRTIAAHSSAKGVINKGITYTNEARVSSGDEDGSGTIAKI